MLHQALNCWKISHANGSWWYSNEQAHYSKRVNEILYSLNSIILECGKFLRVVLTLFFQAHCSSRGRSWKKLIQIKQTANGQHSQHMHKMLLTTVQLRKCFIYWISSSSVAAQNVFCGERAEYKWVTVYMCVENFSKEYQMIHDEYQIWHSPPTAWGWRYLFILFGLADCITLASRILLYLLFIPAVRRIILPLSVCYLIFL